MQKVKICSKIIFENCTFYVLDTNLIRNRNLSKVGIGTVKNSNGSAALLIGIADTVVNCKTCLSSTSLSSLNTSRISMV
jgi:hypothetical protein